MKKMKFFTAMFLLATMLFGFNACSSDDVEDEKTAVIGIVLNKNTITLAVGETENLTMSIAPTNATNQNVTWSSSNKSIAIVEENGKVTAIAMGEAIIEVKTEDGTKTATCVVTVDGNDDDIITAYFDPNFAEGLQKQGYIRNQYEIKRGDVNKITLLDMNYHNISSLDGIQYFKALTKLVCWHNPLTSLDLSNNTALTSLACNSNRLTALDVSKNTALTDLSCSGNQLTALDVSNNIALTYLVCYDNKLTTLDVSKNIALTRLWCRYNQLTTLDVSKNTALTSLSCSGNQLTALDVSKNTVLTDLECGNNRLTTLDVSKNTALTTLWCVTSSLTTLDLSKNIALTDLSCVGNQLTTLDVSKNIALDYLSCGENQLTTLDVSKNTELTYLYLSVNPGVGTKFIVKAWFANDNRPSNLKFDNLNWDWKGNQISVEFQKVN